MLLLPSHFLQKLVCTTSATQLQVCFSAKHSPLMFLPWHSGLINKERNRKGGGADVLLGRDSTFPLTGLQSLKSGPQHAAALLAPHFRRQRRLDSRGKDCLDGGSQTISWVWALLCWPRGPLLGWRSCGVMTSQGSWSCACCKQRKQTGNNTQHCWLEGIGEPGGFLFWCGAHPRAT